VIFGFVHVQVPNASPTAASASSDMYGGATADACAQLVKRLAHYRESMAGKPFAVRDTPML
jgi:xanthine dehydrogenase molybdopterin-binding subunit B